MKPNSLVMDFDGVTIDYRGFPLNGLGGDAWGHSNQQTGKCNADYVFHF
jgi:hypothetical protein